MEDVPSRKARAAVFFLRAEPKTNTYKKENRGVLKAELSSYSIQASSRHPFRSFTHNSPPSQLACFLLQLKINFKPASKAQSGIHCQISFPVRVQQPPCRLGTRDSKVSLRKTNLDVV